VRAEASSNAADNGYHLSETAIERMPKGISGAWPNPEGIAYISEGLARSAYPGNRARQRRTLKGFHSERSRIGNGFRPSL